MTQSPREQKLSCSLLYPQSLGKHLAPVTHSVNTPVEWVKTLALTVLGAPGIRKEQGRSILFLHTAPIHVQNARKQVLGGPQDE